MGLHTRQNWMSPYRQLSGEPANRKSELADCEQPGTGSFFPVIAPFKLTRPSGL
jgi:hypothetical protein